MMSRNGFHAGLPAGILLGALALLAGCRVNVQKGEDGEQKKVQVDTPFGGLHVNTDQTSAADLGLPAYPGATLDTDKDKDDKSADVHVGFGEWQLRVKVVSYESVDDPGKISDFYKKAMTHYGEVLTCKDSHPIGKPEVTSEGLTCEDKDKGSSKDGSTKDLHFNFDDNGGEIELKAGSRRHQHIVAVAPHKDGKTKFALIAVDLPAALVRNSGSSD